MLISKKWLEELVKIPANTKTCEIADKLTLSGFEVENITTVGDDEILDVAITPNRGDALSHIGIARELSSLYKSYLIKPHIACIEMGGRIENDIKINIFAHKSCLRYACRVIRGVQIKPSPNWLKQRLESVGVRSINNVVDVTNYVLLEMGQPLHAFDLSLLHKENSHTEIDIRYANNNEKVTTLDNKEHNLSSDDLVIADKKKIIALAGVMGCANSEVNDKTTDIVLESAYFVPTSIRKTARKLQISTDASYRFERGCDANVVSLALKRAASLIVEVSGGNIMRGEVDCYPSSIQAKEIALDLNYLASLSALDKELIKEDKLRELFLSIGIETIRKDGNTIYFRVPTFRHDLHCSQDLVEEAMRLIGYDNVPVRLGYLHNEIKVSKNNLLKNNFLNKVRSSFLSSGFNETINFSFGSFKDLSLFSSEPKNLIKLKNPLGSEMNTMRPSIVPSLLKNVIYNQNRGRKNISLFEIANVFNKKIASNQNGTSDNIIEIDKLNIDSWAEEDKQVSAVLFRQVGSKDIEKNENNLFFECKGRLQTILSALGFCTSSYGGDINFSPISSSDNELLFLHPGKSAVIKYKDVNLGNMGILHPKIANEFGIDSLCCIINLHLDKLEKLYKSYKLVKPVSKFPSVSRDLAIIVDDSINVSDMLDCIAQAEPGVENLHSINVFDVFKDNSLGKSKKSVGLNFNFISYEDTMKEIMINNAMEEIIKLLSSQFKASLRA